MPFRPSHHNPRYPSVTKTLCAEHLCVKSHLLSIMGSMHLLEKLSRQSGCELKSAMLGQVLTEPAVYQLRSNKFCRIGSRLANNCWYTSKQPMTCLLLCHIGHHNPQYPLSAIKKQQRRYDKTTYTSWYTNNALQIRVLIKTHKLASYPAIHTCIHNLPLVTNQVFTTHKLIWNWKDEH